MLCSKIKLNPFLFFPPHCGRKALPHPSTVGIGGKLSVYLVNTLATQSRCEYAYKMTNWRLTSSKVQAEKVAQRVSHRVRCHFALHLKPDTEGFSIHGL